MKPKTLIPLVIGLAVGFFAIKMGLDMVQKAKGSQEDKSTIYVAAKSIDVATAITEQMLTTKEVPVSLMPQDSFRDKKTLVGRVTKIPIPGGIAISKAMLAPPGAMPGLSAQIPAGHRAVSIKVTEESAVSGFIMPGSRVDVSTVVRTGRGDSASRLVLSNVEVGAVGQSLAKTAGDSKTTQVAKTVTLFLKPEDVQKLNAASGGSKGGLRISLRGHNSDPGESFFAQMLKKMMEDREPEPVPEKEPEVKIAKAEPLKTHTVELRRGGAVEQLVFDERGGVRHVVLSDGNGSMNPISQPMQPQPEAQSAPTEQIETNPQTENIE
ncbi:MAG: Flp pilus assembly protein CpaB [Planctomycetes bacterium]|nr:Flp pilus assembly protein CpaB [Planctomycetota bacterium]